MNVHGKCEQAAEHECPNLVRRRTVLAEHSSQAAEIAVATSREHSSFLNVTSPGWLWGRIAVSRTVTSTAQSLVAESEYKLQRMGSDAAVAQLVQELAGGHARSSTATAKHDAEKESDVHARVAARLAALSPVSTSILDLSRAQCSPQSSGRQVHHRNQGCGCSLSPTPQAQIYSNSQHLKYQSVRRSFQGTFCIC